MELLECWWWTDNVKTFFDVDIMKLIKTKNKLIMDGGEKNQDEHEN